jgi:predicted dehydrogenase
MNTLRVGIIGMGNIGRHHADYLLAGKVSRCELTAICSSSPHKLAKYQAEGLKTFNDSGPFFRSRAMDAVIIATPHYQHPALGIAAFQNGLHVMVEKPIAADKAGAEELLAARQKHRSLTFAAMFQLRAEPRYRKIHELIQSGRLGQLVRINWINTDWYRTDAYYASSDWRATWRGEGGGVLLNQSMHNLDLLCWLCRVPDRVRGFCQFGRFHPIEVEDNVTAYLEWAGVATGVFVSSTGEAPGTNRLEIAGTLGRLVLENNRLEFILNAVDMTEFSRTIKQDFAKPETTREEIPFTDAESPHATMMQNFVNAILNHEPLLAPAGEGLYPLELANALVYSSLCGKTVDLPLDAGDWNRKLHELIAGSNLRQKTEAVAPDDAASSSKQQTVGQNHH